MFFTYRAFKNAKIIKGRIDASNKKEVVDYLKSQEYFPIEIKSDEGGSMEFLNAIFNRVGFVDVVDFTRQLAIMLNAGLTLIDSFNILKRQTVKKSMTKIIDDLDKEIKAGNSFSAALRKYPYLFSNLYIALVKSGEASGKQSEILLKLADNLEKEREFKGKIKGALIYPALIIVGMILVVFVMITFVIPKLLGLYKDFQIDLPMSTQILIAVSDFSVRFWPLIIAAAVGSVMFLRSYLSTKAGKLQYDKLLLRLPVIKRVISISSLVDSTRTLAILTASGVSILDSLAIVVETSGNLVYQNAFKNIQQQVEKGVSLGNAMGNESVFPPILVQMTTVGEQTGHLDETLSRISHYFEMESEMAVKAMTTLIEPSILVFLGIGVGLLVMSVITPIYSLTNSFR